MSYYDELDAYLSFPLLGERSGERSELRVRGDNALTSLSAVRSFSISPHPQNALRRWGLSPRRGSKWKNFIEACMADEKNYTPHTPLIPA